MKFTEFLSDGAALEEIGRRMERLRIEQRLTQAEMAERAGVSRGTVERLERGDSVQLVNLLRCLRALGGLERLEALLPGSPPSPIDLIERKGAERRRVRHRRETEAASPSAWTWGEG